MTIRPLVARSCPRKACVTLNTPLRLMVMMSRQSEDCFRVGREGIATIVRRCSRGQTADLMAMSSATRRHASRSVTSSLRSGLATCALVEFSVCARFGVGVEYDECAPSGRNRAQSPGRCDPPPVTRQYSEAHSYILSCPSCTLVVLAQDTAALCRHTRCACGPGSAAPVHPSTNRSMAPDNRSATA
jgi:hypothetical protein